jgi:RNA polymerase sigma-70 factor (ECF subfamily)
MKLERSSGGDGGGPLDPAHNSDPQLVELVVAQGSEAAFRALYRKYSPRMYRVALRILGSEEDAEDALQETWIRAAHRLSTFAWKSALPTWLTAIAVNVCRDLLDRRGRWTDIAIDENTAATEAVDAVFAIDIVNATAMLAPGCRTAFILHDIEGYTHEEIARMLGYTTGTSKSQVARARRTLRKILEGKQLEAGNNVSE